MNSRAKGKRGELEFIERHLVAVWPDACRNLDQYGYDKRDVLRCAGVHWQIKRTERLDLWGAIAQAQREAVGDDLPVVAFRRNRSPWLCIVEARALIELLALRERVTESHHRGGPALTTVEARGTTQPNAGDRESNPRGDLGRAAGAQLTGQRRDGPSQAPACEQYPGAVHGDSGSQRTQIPKTNASRSTNA